MEYLLFRLIHLSGIFLVLLSLGALIVLFHGGWGERAPGLRRLAFLSNGIGLLLIIFAGFALWPIVVSGPVPIWIFLKMAIWVAIAVLVVLIKRRPDLSAAYWGIALVLAITGAYLALFKPF